jgi:exoribonuclease R
MLPAGYSEGVCSLIPGKKGLGISLIMDWDGKGLDNLMFLKTTVNVRRSYTYDQADADTEGTFDILKKVTTFLSKIEEPNSHDVIEALMILYNREVASILRKKGVGILRRHDAADLDKWEKFKNMNADILFLAFKAAEFCKADAQDVYHAGLSSDAYCTATSPIRRYADLVNQRILKVLLSNGEQEIPNPEISIEWLNKRQKELKHYERDIFFISNMLHNDKRIIRTIVLDWSPIKNEEGRFKIQLYIPDWKRFIKWNVSAKPISEDRIQCVVQQKGQLLETIVEKSMSVRFEIFWNPQVRNWKEKLVLRVA